MEKEIMTPDNSRWEEFTERLEGEEGCNFREGEKGAQWNCNGQEDRPFAKKILKDMGNIDIRSSLKYFDEHGGHCDCEILFNVS